MCLGIPGLVVSLDAAHPDLAVADISGVQRAINIALLEPGTVQPGDWVLIHVGFAMAVIDEEEAARSLELLASLGEGLEGVVAAPPDAERGAT